MNLIKYRPPALAVWIIRRLSVYNEKHSINGDIIEIFNEIRDEKGYKSAVLWYWMQTFLTAFIYLKSTFVRSIAMFKNYLKITFRTLKKNKGFSVINIFGLALSMSVWILLVIFIKDQKNSDTFHTNKDRISRIITTSTDFGWYQDGYASSPDVLAPYLKENYTFIENVVTLRKMGGTIIKNNVSMSVSGLFAEPSFFDIFSYDLLQGDPENALNAPYSIIISEEAALKFFGSDDPINKILTIEKVGDFSVTGVIKNTEQKSHFIFETLVSFSTLSSLENSGVYRKITDIERSKSHYYTYVLFENKNDMSSLEKQLLNIANTLFPQPLNEQYGFELQPLKDINLGLNLSNRMPGTMAKVEISAIPMLAALLMGLACFNYIILSIARSLKRTKEIGLRKVVGSRRNQVIKLFFSETFVVTFLALIASCLFILWLVPIINSSKAVINNGMQINLEMMKDPRIYLYFLLIAIGVSFVAGLYPALYLSSIKPVTALHGVSKIQGLGHLFTRKILMAMQFGVSLFSIIGIVYFYDLHTYWMNLDRGIALEDTVSVFLRDVNPNIFKNEVVSNSNILGISLSGAVPVYGVSNMTKLKKMEIDEAKYAYRITIDQDYMDCFKLHIIAGRNYSEKISSDIENSIILNEKAVKYFNLGSPEESVGKTMIMGEDSEVVIIGVVKDYIFRRYFERAIESLVILYRPQEFRYVNINYPGGRRTEVENFLTESWKRLDSVHPVQLNFLEDFKADFDNDNQAMLITSVWSCGFIILVALFGLLGMAAYSTELRIKEIGIRKAIGASVMNIAYLLSKNYVKLILYSAAVALPCAYFATEIMFQFMAFRPELSLWVLPAALFFILALALVTIGSQTIKAAIANPIETLRDE